MNYRHLFGPVNSRRLGISLGVDMVQFKVCSLNCIYCECGSTTDLTLDRKEYVSGDQIITELDHYLSGSPSPDYITFGGSGEPTLNTAIGRIVRYIKKQYPRCRTALLTNGTLLYREDVREEISPFDLVLPSLDAISDDAFSKVNRPHGSLSNQDIIGGLIAFAETFTGQIWLEVFIVPGINDSPEELAAFRETIARINPSRVQLNSLDRPGAVDWIRPADRKTLLEIAKLLFPLPVEIISREGMKSFTAPPVPADQDRLLDLLKRRPLTVEEIARSMGTTINEAQSFLDHLAGKGLLTSQTVDNRTFFRLQDSPNP